MSKSKDQEQAPVSPGRITPENVRRQNLNPYPESDNEFQSLMIAPQMGRAKIGMDLDKMYNIKHADKRVGSAWDYGTAQTSDTRLSNLRKETEITRVRWAIDVQGKCLMMGLPKSAALVDWDRSSICEPGLGRNGFLRENIQSVHSKSEQINVEQTEKSRSLFGFLNKGGNNGQ